MPLSVRRLTWVGVSCVTHHDHLGLLVRAYDHIPLLVVAQSRIYRHLIEEDGAVLGERSCLGGRHLQELKELRHGRGLDSQSRYPARDAADAWKRPSGNEIITCSSTPNRQLFFFFF